MSEFYSLINSQNATSLDLIPISLNISAILNQGVIKISQTTSNILCLIIIVRLCSDLVPVPGTDVVQTRQCPELNIFYFYLFKYLYRSIQLSIASLNGVLI